MSTPPHIHNHTRCPSCASHIELGFDPLVGQRVVCPLCGNEYRIIWLFPPELEPVAGGPDQPQEDLITGRA